MTETFDKGFTVEHLLAARKLLDENQPRDQKMVFPKWAADRMRERGTWDDRIMIEEERWREGFKP